MLDTVSAKNSVDFPRVNGSDIRITSIDACSRDDCFLSLACKKNNRRMHHWFGGENRNISHIFVHL